MTTGTFCYNWKGDKIEHGQRYITSKAELCESCVCNDGIPTACHNVHCQAPTCEVGQLAQQVEEECCEYYCIELPDHNQDDVNAMNKTPGIIIDPDMHASDTFNRSMRLVASTVTTVLILGLLLYMFHRLKKRRVMVMMRRMRVEQDDENVAYVSNFNSGDVGMSFAPFGDLPPPYSPPKAPDIDEGEPPPPYEATEGENTQHAGDPARNGYIPLNDCVNNSEQQQGQNQSHDSPNHMTNNHHTQGSEDHNTQQQQVNYYPNGAACNLGNESPQEDTSASGLPQSQQPPQNEAQFHCPNVSQKAKVKNLIVSLDRNGKTKSHCQKNTSHLTGNSSNAPAGNTVSKGACKKRHRCPHSKKARAAVKSCSFKDEYSQTLPAQGSRDMDQTVGDRRMCSSYHPSTTTGCDLEDEDDNDAEVDNMDKEDYNRVITGDVAWIKSKEDDVIDIRSSVENSNANPNQRISGASHVVDFIPDKGDSLAESRDHVVTDDRNSVETAVEGVSQPVEISDGSQSSVCSETGEKRISVHELGDDVIMTDQGHLMNVSAGSGDFNSLREAMKGEHSAYQEQDPVSSSEHGPDSVIIDSMLNDQEVDPKSKSFDTTKGTWKESHGMDLKSHQPVNRSSKAAVKDRESNNGRPVKQVSASLVSDKDNQTLTSSPVNQSNKGSVSGGETKAVSENQKNSSGVNSMLMTRSACTAAECGIDKSDNTEDKNKSSSLDGSLSNRLKREHIKRKDSPETYRRLSTAYCEGNAFKQYGFIDTPYSNESMDKGSKEDKAKSAANKWTNEEILKKDGVEKMKKSQEKKDMVSSGRVIPDKQPKKKCDGLGSPNPVENCINKIKRKSKLSKDCERYGENFC